MSAPNLVQLRPPPHPPHPFGPYHPTEDGKWRRFRTDGHKVIRFIEMKCIFTNGKWAGQPFKLLGWEKQLIIDLFELVPDDAVAGGWRRRYRTAYITVGKKQGKTEMAAALSLYFLVADGEQSPNIAVCAAADKQADLVFNAAKTMAEKGPDLIPMVKTSISRITARGQTNAFIQRVPASGGKLDGQNLFVAIADELHEWTLPLQVKTWGMLRGGLAAREQPMFIQITTAGYDKDSTCYEQYEYGLSVEEGKTDDPTFFFRAWEVKGEVDHRDFDRLIEANPSMGVTVQMPFYEDEARHRKPNQMLRYYFNQWTSTDESWLPFGVWEAGNVGPLTIPEGAECSMGWDASTKTDSTALALLYWQSPDDGSAIHVYVKVWIWAAPLTPDGTPDPGWSPPIREVQNIIRESCQTYDVQAVGYDPQFISWEAKELELTEGLPMVDIPNSPAHMVPPTEAAWEMLVHGRFHHEGDPEVARHIERSVPYVTRGGGEMLEKSARGVQNDAAIAILKGFRAWQKYEDELDDTPELSAHVVGRS